MLLGFGWGLAGVSVVLRLGFAVVRLRFCWGLAVGWLGVGLVLLVVGWESVGVWLGLCWGLAGVWLGAGCGLAGGWLECC